MTWWMIIVTAYLELNIAKVDGLSELAKNFYKFAFTILSTQGISAMLLTTIRRWYWGGYYATVRETNGVLPPQQNSNTGNEPVPTDSGSDTNSGSGWYKPPDQGGSTTGGSTTTNGGTSTSNGGSTNTGGTTNTGGSGGTTNSGGSTSGGSTSGGGSSGINFVDQDWFSF